MKQFFKDLDEALGYLVVVIIIVVLIALVVAPHEVFRAIGIL